jgi:hypothetical protein
MFSDVNFNQNIEQYKKEKKMAKDIEYLEIVINTLTTEVENMNSQFDEIEHMLG